MIPYEEKFINHLIANGKSENTIASYLNDLKDLVEFSGSINKTPTTLEKWDFRFLITFLRNKGLSPSTINRKISTIRKYFKFLLSKGIIDEDPSKYMLRPRPSRKIPRPVESRKILDMLSNWEPEGEEEVLAKDIIVLLYLTGMRIGELLSLRGRDIDISNMVIDVKGKGGKYRKIPLTALSKEILAKYITNPEDKIFKINRFKAYRIVRKYFEKFAGISGVHPHTLRHSFATHLMENGADIKTVQSLLGHSNITSTQIYTKVSLKHIREVYKRVWEGEVSDNKSQ